MSKTVASLRLVPVCCVWILAGFFSVGFAQETRVWTSRDGSATMEARFMRQSGDDVTLILPNGRSQMVKRDFLSEADVAWVDSFTDNKELAQSASASKGADSNAKIPAALRGRLVDAGGKAVVLGADGGSVPKYYLFYYSASWCGPCVAFTPELVRFYNRMKASNPQLTVVLVPNDNSAEDALAYMKKARMTFPGVDFNKMKGAGLPGNPGNTIPAMRLTDAAGNDLLKTTDVSRDKFLNEARKIVSAN